MTFCAFCSNAAETRVPFNSIQISLLTIHYYKLVTVYITVKVCRNVSKYILRLMFLRVCKSLTNQEKVLKNWFLAKVISLASNLPKSENNKMLEVKVGSHISTFWWLVFFTTFFKTCLLINNIGKESKDYRKRSKEFRTIFFAHSKHSRIWKDYLLE